MASGLLGKALLAANTDTLLYTVPASTVATATVSICNTTLNAVTASLAITAGASVSAGDYLVFNLSIPQGGTYERTGIVLSTGESIVVRSGAVGVSARAHGFEEAP